jgi:fructokinase
VESHYGGIEAGGTKIVCVVAAHPKDVQAETRFPTTTPEETLNRAIDFFEAYQSDNGKLQALGVASFGPLDPNPASSQYGYITTTPKTGWENFNLIGHLKGAFDLPIGFDTDVNGAALGEWRWGAALGLDTFMYLTVGTGIGGGGMVNGELMHGLLHPEMGHIWIPHNWEVDPFEGVCDFHGDCFEGLASGPAIEKRWGKSGEFLPREHAAWELESDYLAHALMNYICIQSPQRIILGGGVMEQSHLFPKVRSRVQELLNGYIQMDQILYAIDDYIVPPKLGSKAGVMGAIALAYAACEQSS